MMSYIKINRANTQNYYSGGTPDAWDLSSLPDLENSAKHQPFKIITIHNENPAPGITTPYQPNDWPGDCSRAKWQ